MVLNFTVVVSLGVPRFLASAETLDVFESRTVEQLGLVAPSQVRVQLITYLRRPVVQKMVKNMIPKITAHNVYERLQHKCISELLKQDTAKEIHKATGRCLCL